MSKPTPTFNPAGSRYDQSAFEGRLAHFREMTDPATLLVDDTVLKKAQDLLANYDQGDRTASDADLWEAKRIKDAIIHPVTGEKMFLPGRMSAFVPANTIPTAGMLLAKTPMQTVFWQWINQSVNVMCNYVNRSGATVDVSQVAQAYGLAVAASCGIAVGAGKLVASGPPWVKRLGIAVPYAAVVSAGAANVAFTRMPEITDGVPITAPDGTKLGVSKLAAQSAVLNVCGPLPTSPSTRTHTHGRADPIYPHPHAHSLSSSHGHALPTARPPAVPPLTHPLARSRVDACRRCSRATCCCPSRRCCCRRSQWRRCARWYRSARSPAPCARPPSSPARLQAPCRWPSLSSRRR